MSTPSPAALDGAIEDLPKRHPGPGGAVAVVKDGEPIVRHAWGFADLDARQPYTPRDLCADLLDLEAVHLRHFARHRAASPPRSSGRGRATAAPPRREADHARPCQQPVRPARLLGADRPSRSEGREGFRREDSPADRPDAEPALRARHPLFLLQRQLPHRLRADRGRDRRGARYALPPPRLGAGGDDRRRPHLRHPPARGRGGRLRRQRRHRLLPGRERDLLDRRRRHLRLARRHARLRGLDRRHPRR